MTQQKVNYGRYAFKIIFNRLPQGQIKLQAWDDDNCNSVNKIFFTGTTLRPLPLIIAYNPFNPPSDLLSLEPIEGGAENNRLKGNQFYKTFIDTELIKYFYIVMEIPKDLPLINDYFTLKIDFEKEPNNPRCSLFVNIGDENMQQWVRVKENDYFTFTSLGFENKVLVIPFAHKLTEAIMFNY